MAEIQQYELKVTFKDQFEDAEMVDDQVTIVQDAIDAAIGADGKDKFSEYVNYSEESLTFEVHTDKPRQELAKLFTQKLDGYLKSGKSPNQPKISDDLKAQFQEIKAAVV